MTRINNMRVPSVKNVERLLHKMKEQRYDKVVGSGDAHACMHFTRPSVEMFDFLNCG